MNDLIIKDNIKIEELIYEVRGKQVMLDSDLAKLYGCKNGTKSLNLAVKRHINKFPERFMFQLTENEIKLLRFQNETTNNMSRTLPYVFTEQGVAMLATVLKTEVADEMSIKIMDAFVTMKNYINNNFIIFHDRFIIIDNKELYNIGSSLKDIGKKCSSVNKIEDTVIISELIDRLKLIYG